MTIERLEVVQVAQLARLTHTLATGEALVAVELKAVVHIVEEAHIEQECANSRACAPLSTVAVHNKHILRILYTQRRKLDMPEQRGHLRLIHS